MLSHRTSASGLRPRGGARISNVCTAMKWITNEAQLYGSNVLQTHVWLKCFSSKCLKRLYIYIYIYIYVCVCVCVHVRVCMYMYMFMCVGVCRACRYIGLCINHTRAPHTCSHHCIHIREHACRYANPHARIRCTHRCTQSMMHFINECVFARQLYSKCIHSIGLHVRNYKHKYALAHKCKFKCGCNSNVHIYIYIYIYIHTYIYIYIYAHVYIYERKR